MPQGEGDHLQAREASEETYPTDILILDFQPLQLREKKFLLLKHPVDGILLWQP